VTPALRRGCQ